MARYAGIDSEAALDWFNRQLKKANDLQKKALNYGKSLVYIDSGKYKQAHELLDPLLAAEPNNRFYIDSATDLDLYEKNYDQAIARLEKALKDNPKS